MNAQIDSYSLTLEPNDTDRLANLCGQFDEHIRQIEKRLGIEIRNRGNAFQLVGSTPYLQAAKSILQDLYHDTLDGDHLTPDDIHLYLQQSAMDARRDTLQNNSDKTGSSDTETEPEYRSTVIHTRKTTVKARGPSQKSYVHSIRDNDINFGIGPAGTGKTYLAVACAVEALQAEQVRRIMLVRPAVEAGEKLGFLPGDISQKVDPYLRPLYDALYEMLGFDHVAKLIERNIIEIAPLAFMRGRSLNNSFVILDESQNTTPEQMKMFLTRIGFGSTAVITGDITQIDLAKGTRSGLVHVLDILNDIPSIGFTHFTSKDVVRHPIVQCIVEAYDKYDSSHR